MPSIGNLLSPAAAAAGIGRSLALARGANPRASVAGPFDQQLDLALRAGAGGGGDLHVAAVDKTSSASTRIPFDVIGGAVSIEALRNEHKAALTEFEDRIRQLLRESGIELGEGVVLETNADGDVRVAGEHPQKQAIERLFQDDLGLRNQFLQLEAQANLIRAADRPAGLARLQTDLPSDAAAQIHQLLADATPGRFSLAVRRHEATVQFN